jgi:para-aminobenzoate synthetase component 1
LALVPERGDAAYLALVDRALADIRAGRFYQINLLRYYQVAGLPDRSWMGRRLAAHGGPHAAFFDVPGLTLASFSPERFVQLLPHPAGAGIEARPIKGTAPRLPDPSADAAAARGLLASRKDLAELHMIVDLMRNDLNRVAVPGSVRVPAAAALVTLPTVHHLEARVTALLAPGLRLGDLVAALCPGGSITGAPKVEVMTAIRAYEGRSRGYFMGNAFYLDDGGGFDSSILIRTLVRRGDFAYEFAAGSGIVIGSDADTERREIAAKCGVVTADLPKIS